MARFQPAYNKTQGHEGGYSNVSTDRGGETWKGIARKRHPDWSGWEIIDQYRESYPQNFKLHLNQDANLETLVFSFYKEEFWDVMKLDQVNSQGIAEELFDTGVNQGAGTAAKFLQRSINLLNKNQLVCPDIDDDGGIGRITLGALNKVMAHYVRYGEGEIERAFLKAINGLQFERYKDICEDDPTQEANFFGWVRNRIEI